MYFSAALLSLLVLGNLAHALTEMTHRTSPYRHGCVRYSCEIHWCILGDDEGPSVGAFADKASCLYWQFLGYDCGAITSNIRKLPAGTKTLVQCPEDGQIFATSYHIWRSPEVELASKPLRLIWGADADTPAMVNSTMVAGTCTQEQKKITCHKGTPFGDCINKSVSCPMVPNPEWNPQ